MVGCSPKVPVVDCVEGNRSGKSGGSCLPKSLGSDKYGGELLPTIISFRELVESFNKKSGALISDTRKMLGDLSASINKSDARPPRR